MILPIMCVCGGMGGRGGGGHNLVNKFYCFFFMFQTILNSFQGYFPPLYFFQKFNYFDGWGVPPLPMENSRKIIIFFLSLPLLSEENTKGKSSETF